MHLHYTCDLPPFKKGEQVEWVRLVEDSCEGYARVQTCQHGHVYSSPILKLDDAKAEYSRMAEKVVCSSET